MADFDPQQPSDNETKDTAPAQPARRQWEYSGGSAGSSGSCGDSCGCEGKREGRRDDETDSFVSDWSGAEKSLEEQAASFEARQSEMADAERMESAPPRSETFWVELVRSQVGPQTAASTALARPVDIEAKGVQSETFWADLVKSQSTDSSSTSGDSTRVVSSLTDRPSGMGWADDEASEWAPPQREYEPVQPAGEPLEAESGSDVAWSTPVSAQDDWETARSEGMSFESTGSSRPSLMAAAVEAAKAVKQPKEKKAKATKVAKPVAKKAKAKKAATKAKKPAAKAKKPAAKKVAKKVTPAPKITKAPTRRAA